MSNLEWLTHHIGAKKPVATEQNMTSLPQDKGFQCQREDSPTTWPWDMENHCYHHQEDAFFLINTYLRTIFWICHHQQPITVTANKARAWRGRDSPRHWLVVARPQSPQTGLKHHKTSSHMEFPGKEEKRSAKIEKNWRGWSRTEMPGGL